jgi:hypothetical protein
MGKQKIKREKVVYTSGDLLETLIRKMCTLFRGVFVENGKDDAIAQSQESRIVHQQRTL